MTAGPTHGRYKPLHPEGYPKPLAAILPHGFSCRALGPPGAIAWLCVRPVAILSRLWFLILRIVPEVLKKASDGSILLVVKYHPKGAAAQLWRCKDPEVLIEGPAGTGKSLALLHKLNALCFKYPGLRVLIVRKTRSSMTESVLATLESKVFVDHESYPDWRGIKRRIRQEYEYPNGSVMVVRGMDNADSIMSTDFDVIGVFEATELTENDFETLTTRLRNGRMPYQQILCDCNPDRPSHWLNVRAARPYAVAKGMEGYLPAARPGQTQMTRLLSRHEDNPMLWDEQKGAWTEQGANYISKLEALGGARYLRLRVGKWAASEGLVYPEFDPLKHVLDYGSKEFPFTEIPKTWRRIRAIDFGFTNPFVCLWFAIDPDGRMYLYREIYRAQTVVEDHARRIAQLSGDERFEATVADHDAEDRATLARHGITTRKAFKAIMPGIENVSVRLRMAGDGKPRLFVMRNALVDRDEMLAEQGAPVSTLEEFDGYIYPKVKDGKAAKEEPLDLNNHGMDSLRYACAYVDDLARKKFKMRGGRVSAAKTRAA